MEIEKLQVNHVDSENTSEYGNVANDVIALGTALLISSSQNVTVMALMDLKITFPSGISSMEKKVPRNGSNAFEFSYFNVDNFQPFDHHGQLFD